MDSFVVSARKYRPATFETVVGQAAITGTLKNALGSNHLAQAFLFCGPRGVGKTTCARILAKTINCQNLTSSIEACNECDSCKSFSTGHSLNIFELDAASNNSVEDIRNLISQVSFAPQLGKFKVYIIDEVHMLSPAAFNAFLKTLEEPPRHAVFILATTEKHKIIPTILSRCQIYDFNRIQVKDIASHLAFIAKNEGIHAEPDALHIISQKADGALRDALSIFDQLVSFSGKNLSYQAVIANLNVLDYDYYFKITEEILRHRISGSLLIFNEILHKGFDGHNFINGLAGHFRNLLVCKDASTLQLLEVSENVKTKYQDQSHNCSEYFLLKGLEITNTCDIQYKISKNARLLVELSLMQMCSLESPNDFNEKKKSKLKILPPENSENGSNHSGIPPVMQKTAGVEEKKENYISLKNDLQPSPAKDQTKHSSLPIPGKDGKTASEARIRLKTKNISINGHFQSQGSENGKGKVENAMVEKPSEIFSENRLLEVWNEFASTSKLKGKESLYSILTKRSPQLQPGFQIDFIIENTVQETSLHDAKPELMEFLNRELNNFRIELNIIVIKELHQKQAYTNREKFLKLAEKNPLLLKMKQQMDLDID